MKRFLFLITLFFIGSLVAQKTFQKTFAVASKHFEAQSVIVTSDGSYAITGEENQDILLIKTDACGTVLWSKKYGGTGQDAGYSVKQTTDGGYIITGGTSTFGIGGEVILIKTDNAGIVEWSKIFGGNGFDRGMDVEQTLDGGFVITGYTDSFGAGYYDIYLLRTDGLGTLLWTKIFGKTENEFGFDVVQAADSGFVVAGYGNSFGSTNNDVIILKADKNGNLQWNKHCGGSSTEEGHSIVKTTDGGYAVSGHKSPAIGTKSDFFIIKLKSDGDTLWTRAYGTSGTDNANEIWQTQDGGYIVGGDLNGWNGTLSTQDIGIAKLNAAGNMQWYKSYGGNREDYNYSIAPAQDKGYVLAGSSRSWDFSFYQLYFIRTDSFGNSGCYEQGLSLSKVTSPVTYADASLASASGGVETTIIVTANNFTFIEDTKCINCSNILSAVITATANVACNNDTSGSVTVTPFGGQPPYSYAWSGGGTNAMETGLGVGTYTVIVYDSGGDSVIVTANISLGNLLSASITNIVSPLCFADSTGSASVNVIGGNAPYIFSWLPYGGTAINADSLKAGTYTVTISDKNGCDTLLVFLLNGPAPLNTGINGDTIICEGEATVLTAFGGTSYLWSTTESTPSVIVFPAATQSYSVTIMNSCDTVFENINIVVNTAPAASVGNDTTIFEGESVRLNGGNGASSYLWYPSTWLSCDTCEDPLASPLQTTTYYLVAFNGNCADTISITIYVESVYKIYFPNSFSPNEDEENDVLKIYGVGIKNIRLEIFNRWGEKVFETTNQLAGWDGTYRGKQLTTGVFAYYLSVDFYSGTTKNLKGNITLIR